MTNTKSWISIALAVPAVVFTSALFIGCGKGSENSGEASSYEIDAAKVTAPDGFKSSPGDLDDAALLAKGNELWKDTKLGTSGLSCNTCHATPTQSYKESFAKDYPHAVGMAKDKAGVEKVSAAEMVQFCLVAPMKGKPLAWDSVELAALTRAVNDRQKQYREEKAAK